MVKCEAQKSKGANILGRREYITFGHGGQGRVTSEEMIKVSSDLQVCGLGQATWFVLLFALSHVCKVSFICSSALMHEFRGSLCAYCPLCSIMCTEGELCMLFGLNACV
jgi:hypothetical protein